MSDVNSSAAVKADHHDLSPTAKNQGTLKGEGKEHVVFPFADTESVSEGVSKFLGEMQQEQELSQIPLSDHVFTEITTETIEIETEIMELFEGLEKSNPNGKETEQTQLESKSQLQNKHSLQGSKQGAQNSTTQPEGKSEVVYSSLFSLAHSFNKNLTESRKQNLNQKTSQDALKQTHDERCVNQPMAFSTRESDFHEFQMDENHYDKQEKDEEKQEDQSGGGQQEQQQELMKQKMQRKANRKIEKTQTSRRTVESRSSQTQQTLGSVENIYIRFMALMARILGQAEAEAHSLYLRIKERTDNIDRLTLFISKINSEKGDIDWSDNEEMKQLIDQVRALGVDIPEGKYAWNEDEKRLLKENIQMRKDSMEKITQLERTDMQRYLQEASQCHQARSNVLKLLKEVMDTIIHNMRP